MMKHRFPERRFQKMHGSRTERGQQRGSSSRQVLSGMMLRRRESRLARSQLKTIIHPLRNIEMKNAVATASAGFCAARFSEAVSLTGENEVATLESVALCADSSSELWPPSSQQLPAGCFPQETSRPPSGRTGGLRRPLKKLELHMRSRRGFGRNADPFVPQRRG